MNIYPVTNIQDAFNSIVIIRKQVSHGYKSKCHSILELHDIAGTFYKAPISWNTLDKRPCNPKNRFWFHRHTTRMICIFDRLWVIRDIPEINDIESYWIVAREFRNCPAIILQSRRIWERFLEDLTRNRKTARITNLLAFPCCCLHWKISLVWNQLIILLLVQSNFETYVDKIGDRTDWSQRSRWEYPISNVPMA